MLNPVTYRQNFSAHTKRQPSPNIWHDCPALEFMLEGTGYFWHEDFAGFRTSANINAAEAYWARGLKAFGSDGGAIADADIQGGGITLSSDGDNEGVSLGMMVPVVQLSRTHGKLWFEIRLKTSTIADTKHGWFAGLIDSAALSATVPIAAAGTLADENFVGFHRLEGDGDKVDTVYKADGVTQVTVEADFATLVADTWIKLGFSFDAADGNKLTFYVDGVPSATTYTMASAAGTDFPNDVRLGFVFALLNATATTPGNTTLDWVRLAQWF